jgi:hypothetical protein
MTVARKCLNYESESKAVSATSIKNSFYFGHQYMKRERKENQ